MSPTRVSKLTIAPCAPEADERPKDDERVEQVSGSNQDPVVRDLHELPEAEQEAAPEPRRQ